MTELLPCPFCGGKAYTAIGQLQNEGHGYVVFCDSCHVHQSYLDRTEAEAIAAWNTRAERTCKPLDYTIGSYTHKAMEKDEWYCQSAVCSACGEYIPIMNYCPNCGAKVVD